MIVSRTNLSHRNNDIYNTTRRKSGFISNRDSSKENNLLTETKLTQYETYKISEIKKRKTLTILLNQQTQINESLKEENLILSNQQTALLRLLEEKDTKFTRGSKSVSVNTKSEEKETKIGSLKKNNYCMLMKLIHKITTKRLYKYLTLIKNYSLFKKSSLYLLDLQAQNSDEVRQKIILRKKLIKSGIGKLLLLINKIGNKQRRKFFQNLKIIINFKKNENTNLIMKKEEKITKNTNDQKIQISILNISQGIKKVHLLILFHDQTRKKRFFDKIMCSRKLEILKSSFTYFKNSLLNLTLRKAIYSLLSRNLAFFKSIVLQPKEFIFTAEKFHQELGVRYLFSGIAKIWKERQIHFYHSLRQYSLEVNFEKNVIESQQKIDTISFISKKFIILNSFFCDLEKIEYRIKKHNCSKWKNISQKLIQLEKENVRKGILILTNYLVKCQLIAKEKVIYKMKSLIIKDNSRINDTKFAGIMILKKFIYQKMKFHLSEMGKASFIRSKMKNLIRHIMKSTKQKYLFKVINKWKNLTSDIVHSIAIKEYENILLREKNDKEEITEKIQILKIEHEKKIAESNNELKRASEQARQLAKSLNLVKESNNSKGIPSIKLRNQVEEGVNTDNVNNDYKIEDICKLRNQVKKLENELKETINSQKVQLNENNELEIQNTRCQDQITDLEEKIGQYNENEKKQANAIKELNKIINQKTEQINKLVNEKSEEMNKFEKEKCLKLEKDLHQATKLIENSSSKFLKLEIQYNQLLKNKEEISCNYSKALIVNEKLTKDIQEKDKELFKNSALSKNLINLTQAIDNLAIDKENLIQKLEQANSDLIQTKITNKQLMESNLNFEAKMNEISNNSSSLKYQINIQELEKLNKSLTQELIKAKEEIKILKDNSSFQKMDGSPNDIISPSQKAKSFKSQTHTDKFNNEVRLKQLKELNSKLQKSVVQKNNQIDKLKEENKQLADELLILSNQNSEKNVMISKIKEELVIKEKELNEIQNFTEQAKDKANILVSEMSSLKEDKEKLQFQAKKAQESLKFQNIIQILEQENSKINNKLSQQLKDEEVLKAKIDLLESNKEQFDSIDFIQIKEKAEKEKLMYENKINNLLKANDENKVRLEAKENEVNTYINVNNNVQIELQKALIEMENYAKILEAFEIKVQELESEKQKATKERDMALQELTKWKKS